MSDHKFEQQVRQKLGDLKLTPTTNAWENIENELRQGKRRRSPLLWLPVLLLGLGAAGYFMWKPSANSLENNPIVSQKAATPNDHPNPSLNNPLIENNNTLNDKSSSSNIASNNNQNNSTIAADKKGIASYAPDGRAEKVTNQNNISSNNNQVISGNKPFRSATNIVQDKNAPRKTDPASQNNHHSAVDRSLRPLPNNAALHAEESERTTPAAGTSTTSEEKETAEEQKNEIPEPLNDSPVQSTDTGLPANAAAAVTAASNDRKAKKKKYAFGVTASTGLSAVNEGKFVNFGVPQVEDVAVLPAPPSLYAPAAPTAAPPPSKIYPGFSYSAGVVVSRGLSRRLSLSIGLNYLQLNTRTEVGYKIDASGIPNRSANLNAQLGLYYLPGSGSTTTEYRNRYHFIELPLTIHTRINNSTKLPVYWNAGISISRLLSSNSLHYDGLTNVYYRNDDLLNKVQGTFNTGFSISVFNRSRHPFWIGPSARYNISPLLKKDISSRKNFMGLGLDLKWYLK